MITEKLQSKRDFNWADVQEPDASDFERLNSEFGLPYLLVQDCLKPEHLPKFEETDEGYFLMMRSFDEKSSPDDTTVQELTRKIAIFISRNRLITIHRVELPYLDAVAERARKSESPKTIQGMVHQIILAIIRSYETPISNLQDMYDDFEQEILALDAQHLSTKRIYHFRRQIFLIKRILKQTNDALLRFREFFDDYPSMLQDLRENIDQFYFQLDEVSDNFEHLFQLHIALNDQRANEIMKILTVFSSVLLPLNFIASFYGMNFDFLPGLHSIHGLNAVMLSMMLISIGAIWYFKRKGWFITRD